MSSAVVRENSQEKTLGQLSIEETGCNLCGSEDRKTLFTETYSLGDSTTDLKIVRCRNCDLVYTSPRLTPDSTQLVYRFDAAHTISHNYCWDGSPEGDRFQPLLDRLEKWIDGGRLLDVGCGGGHFLAEAKKTGKWDVVGVEPSENAARQAEERAGCTVYADILENASLDPSSFDVVSMLGVLEHLHDPSSVLQHTHGLMNPSGLLAVYVPNFDYLRLKDTGPVCLARRGRWSDLHPQEHLFQFTPRSLEALLKRNGFELLRLDIGQPFGQGSPLKRIAKKAAYHSVCTLKKLTGIHMGGLEAIARRVDV